MRFIQGLPQALFIKEPTLNQNNIPNMISGLLSGLVISSLDLQEYIPYTIRPIRILCNYPGPKVCSLTQSFWKLRLVPLWLVKLWLVWGLGPRFWGVGAWGLGALGSGLKILGFRSLGFRSLGFGFRNLG